MGVLGFCGKEGGGGGGNCKLQIEKCKLKIGERKDGRAKLQNTICNFHFAIYNFQSPVAQHSTIGQLMSTVKDLAACKNYTMNGAPSNSGPAKRFSGHAAPLGGPPRRASRHIRRLDGHAGRSAGHTGRLSGHL
jgi:hypothetical protein